MKNDDYEGSYFTSVVKDAISQLKKVGSAVVFSKDQLDYILKKLPQAKSKFDDGFYYISMEVKEK